ncbi:MAG: alpha-glucan family phosphorylase [Candidatus Hydrogenedentes bacterium]|nr:alpha-glucan family phosphorylase [Candidatus Hydrogenedentota bacterium]
MPNVSTYTVVPKLPPRLSKLMTIANNLWWCWDPEAIELFIRVDRELWTDCNQNPRQLLGQVSQLRLESLARDDSFLAHLDRVADRLNKYLHSNSWAEKNPEAPEGFGVAYLSLEFGLHESISIYSGGLGLLAGDHLKSASDLGVPLVGVGLLYREGYFTQYLNADGWQQERYPQNDFYNMEIETEPDASGKQIIIEIEYPERVVKARIWRCQVGRVPLYLLDCDFDVNQEDDREITARLYQGDRDMRIRQEIMLGMGAVKAMRALGLKPTIYHMNEGHAAFMTLQRVHDLVQNEALTFRQAAEAVKTGSVFTTHTPVPAGNDMFAPETITHYFSKYCADVSVSMDELLALGRQNPRDSREPFCMTVLAIKLSTFCNGVSKLHGEVARAMWMRIWDGIPANETPITSITNGVHVPFWISRDLAILYDRYIGPEWISNPDDQSVWRRVDDVPDAELWRTHERRRERLVSFARRRVVSQMQHRGAPSAEIAAANEALDAEVLTIGFARRFATYKRATLLLMDEERLVRLLSNDHQPVQIILAGKAHPQDSQAKELIRRIIHFARQPEIRNRLVFIENYDITVARHMVQGVDCWLNTPRRPMEASGTSGMKAATNGALNISVLDGWWCEAESLGENGWSIGRGESYPDPAEQDHVESEALYEILEKEIVPMFYERTRDGLPRRWVARMKTAIRTICPVFNTNRMVQEYTERFYIPCTLRRNVLRGDKRKRSLALSAWKQKVEVCWERVHFANVTAGPTENLPYGSALAVTAEVYLDELTKDDVVVELYYGDIDLAGHIPKGKTVQMECAKGLGERKWQFAGAIPCDKTGRLGFMVRVIPNHRDLANKHETTHIVWA